MYEFSLIISDLDTPKNNIIIAGDFNINLLEINEKQIYCDFFDLLMTKNFLPQITLPTCFTDTKWTLIDNLFSNMQFANTKQKSGIIIDKFSDHQPCFVILKTEYPKQLPVKFVKINTVNDKTVLNLIHHLTDADIYTKLDKSPAANVYLNYEIIQSEIGEAIRKHIPNKLVKYDKYKHKKINGSQTAY